MRRRGEKLTDKHRRFIAAYMISGNAKDAAIEAGYSGKHAASQGFQLMKNPAVKKELEKRHESILAKAEISATEVLLELKKVGFANMQDYLVVGEDGLPRLDWSKLTREQAASLAEVTVDTYTEGGGEDAREVKKVKFKLADKLSALDKLARHLGLFNADKSGAQTPVAPLQPQIVNFIFQKVEAAAQEKVLKSAW